MSATCRSSAAADNAAAGCRRSIARRKRPYGEPCEDNTNACSHTIDVLAQPLCADALDTPGVGFTVRNGAPSAAAGQESAPAANQQREPRTLGFVGRSPLRAMSRLRRRDRRRPLAARFRSLPRLPCGTAPRRRGAPQAVGGHTASGGSEVGASHPGWPLTGAAPLRLPANRADARSRVPAQTPPRHRDAVGSSTSFRFGCRPGVLLLCPRRARVNARRFR